MSETIGIIRCPICGRIQDADGPMRISCNGYETGSPALFDRNLAQHEPAEMVFIRVVAAPEPATRRVPTHWEGHADEGEAWTVEIEHDRFSGDSPFVVSLWLENRDEGEPVVHSLATPSPAQAREMAAALTVYADAAEAENKTRDLA